MNARNNGSTKHPLYKTYKGMKTRCYNKNTPGYKDYGARGIVMCDEWLNDFWQFVKDMGDKPTPKHSLERKDNNGIYCKSNCVWETSTVQNRNQRLSSRNKSGYKGVHFHKVSQKWAASIRINSKSKHLGIFADIEDAIEARKLAEQKYW